MAINIELRAHASIQRKANFPRTYYSGVSCPWKESWGRDSLLLMGTAYSEVTCPRGTGCSGAKCPWDNLNGPDFVNSFLHCNYGNHIHSNFTT